MQVGGVSHGFGTSRLWHDPNYEVARDYRPIAVQKGMGLDEDLLPKEEHVLPPEKKADPYVVQEKAYDTAAVQMSRGLEGRKLLNGTSNPAAFDAAVAATRSEDATRTAIQARAQDVTRTHLHAAQLPVDAGQPTGNVRPQQLTPFAAGQVSKPDGASQTAADKDNRHVAQDASDTSRLVDAVALGVGGVSAAIGAAKIASVSAAAAPAAAATGATAAAATTSAGAATLATHDQQQDGPLDPDGRRR